MNTGIATKDKFREILDMLIFDPDNILIDKSHLIPKCEERILSMYFHVVKKTGTLNFDELIVDIIMFNNEILQMAAQHALGVDEETISNYDLLRCDYTRWIREMERAEISAFAPISEWVIDVLTRYGLAFIPYMEESYEDHSKQAFGVHGTIVVNDCQNTLFPQMKPSEGIRELNLGGDIDNVLFTRSLLSDGAYLKGSSVPA